MITLSLCMILRDEEAVLARCLDTVKDVFDEIILADTGSEDGTKKIAADYTDKIYDFLPPEILLFPELPRITGCGWMPMISCPRKHAKN